MHIDQITSTYLFAHLELSNPTMNTHIKSTKYRESIAQVGLAFM